MYEFKFNYCKTLSSVSGNEIDGTIFLGTHNLKKKQPSRSEKNGAN